MRIIRDEKLFVKYHQLLGDFYAHHGRKHVTLLPVGDTHGHL
ncbi:hypothetical protein [Brevibacillus laterosporus]|nr:hypothetical protein [Brevibacillus laterosporus]